MFQNRLSVGVQQYPFVRHAHGVALALGVLLALAFFLEVAGGGTGVHGLTAALVVIGLAGLAAGSLHVTGGMSSHRQWRDAYRFAAVAIAVGALAIAIAVLVGA